MHDGGFPEALVAQVKRRKKDGGNIVVDQCFWKTTGTTQLTASCLRCEGVVTGYRPNGQKCKAMGFAPLRFTVIHGQIRDGDLDIICRFTNLNDTGSFVSLSMNEVNFSTLTLGFLNDFFF